MTRCPGGVGGTARFGTTALERKAREVGDGSFEAVAAGLILCVTPWTGSTVSTLELGRTMPCAMSSAASDDSKSPSGATSSCAEPPAGPSPCDLIQVKNV